MWKFNFKMTRERWFLVLAAGICLLILAMPSGSRQKTSFSQEETKGASSAGSDSQKSYERQLEDRVKKFLSTVDGVGKVDVMIVLKSSEEKVFRTDSASSVSETEEVGGDGTSRRALAEEKTETTVLSGSGSDSSPLIEKEIRPEIEGIIVSAQGGGNQVIQEEISAALEALFHVPRHKIRVLKRVE